MNEHVVEILLVEDSETDAELTLRALRRAHVANGVKHVRDGIEAIDFLTANNVPRVVLLDLKLPRMNGIEVLERIRKDPKTKRLPVVILTSSREEPDIKRCYELGVNSYIVKPVEFNDFAETVSKLGFYWVLMNEAEP